MRRYLLALFAAVALTAAACGDDDLDLEAIADDVASEDAATDDPEAASGEEPEPAADPEPEASDDPDSESDGSSDSDSDSPKTPLDADAKAGSETLSTFFEGGISADSEACMIDRLLDDPDLLAAVLAVEPDGAISDLSEANQIAALDLGLSCVTAEELSQALQADFAADLATQALAGDAADCFARSLTDDSDPDRAQLLLALVALDDGQAPTPEQGQLVVGLMTECVSPELLVDATLQSVVDDPLLATALDRPCLDAAVGAPGYLDQFWGLLLENTDVEFEALLPDQQRVIITPFFECISFGAVIAAAAADEGVTLSADTIGCIDGALDTGGLVDTFLTGTELDEAQLFGAILPCLSAEELGALG